MSSRGGRGHTRLLRARESPCAQQTSGPEVPTQPGPPSPVPLRGLGAGDLAASHQLHAVWPRAPHPPLGASAPSSVTPRPAVGARGRPAPGPAEAPSTLAREECAPTAEARLPCTPDVAGGRHPQRTRRDRRGQGGSEGHTPPCQRGEVSTAPTPPWGLGLVLLGTEPGSRELSGDSPPCVGVAIRLDREEPQAGTGSEDSGRCSSFLCGRIPGSSLHPGSEKSRTGTWEAHQGPAQGEPRAAPAAVVRTASLVWGGWRVPLPQAPPAAARLHSWVCSLIHSTNPVPSFPGETPGSETGTKHGECLVGAHASPLAGCPGPASRPRPALCWAPQIHMAPPSWPSVRVCSTSARPRAPARKGEGTGRASPGKP